MMRQQLQKSGNPDLMNHPVTALERGMPQDLEELEMRLMNGEQFNRSKDAELAIEYGFTINDFETTRKQLWDTYYKMVDDFGDSSDEALDALKAAQQFTLENTKSRFNAKYHSIINSLPEAAERAVKPLKAERRAILAKYKVFRFEDGRTAEIYDMADITAEDANRLDEIAKELNGVASTYTNTGEQKTGEALLIANQLSDYNKRVQELYEEQGVADTAFEARKAKIEERSPEQLADWLKKNQQETLTDEFWDTFNSIIAALGSTDISNTIKNLIKPFKKADGSVDTEAIPADVLADTDKPVVFEAPLAHRQLMRTANNSVGAASNQNFLFENDGVDSRCSYNGVPVSFVNLPANVIIAHPSKSLFINADAVNEDANFMEIGQQANGADHVYFKNVYSYAHAVQNQARNVLYS